MKVRLEKDYRKLYTLEDLDRAKAVIEGMKKDDTSTPAEMMEYVAAEIRNYNKKLWSMDDVLKAEARTARNRRVWNLYNDDSENMDVWIDFIIDFGNAIVKGGAYLSDIWQSGAVPYYDHMFIQIFKRMGD